MVNPFKSVYKAIRFIILDTIDDIKWMGIIIKRMIKKEPIVNPEKAKALSDALRADGVKGLFVNIWPWLVLAIFCGVVGWMFAAKFYQIECNRLIIEAINISTSIPTPVFSSTGILP